MPSPHVLEPGTKSGVESHLRDRLARHPVVAGLTAGLVLWSAFPPVEWSWLAWMALVPLFWLVIQPGPRLWLYLGAWIGGLTFWGLSVQWVRLTDPSAWLAWLALALIFSLWWPGFLFLARLAVLRLEIPLMMAAPILWVGMEYIRAHVLTGFPWYYLGHSQYRFLMLIQIADTTSALGISFLIAIVNAWIVDLLALPLMRRSARGTRLTARQTVRLWVVGLMVGGTLLYGSYRLATARFRNGPRLALLQTNFAQRYKMGGDPLLLLERLEQLVHRAMSVKPRPDLIVWPETAYPFGYIATEDGLPAEVLARQMQSIGGHPTTSDWIDRKERIAEYLHGMTDAAGIPMLVGSLYYDHRQSGFSKYNSAILFEPAVQTIRAYHKIHLVPFGEFIPFLETLPWLTVFTPYRNGYLPTLRFGHDPRSLSLGQYRMAIAICFEDTVPHVIRRFFREAPDGRQPDMLVNISNDGWFHGSAELDMHLAVSVFRTIEHRVPLARAVNTGISALIDGNGEIRDSLPRETETVLSVSVPLDDRTSNYTVLGDWVGMSCLAVTIGLVPLWFLRSRRRRHA
ncbi:MAG: apolipoprotein N-acyltransferase [Isosphaeraceae bacterium]